MHVLIKNIRGFDKKSDFVSIFKRSSHRNQAFLKTLPDGSTSKQSFPEIPI